ncbi:MAG: hypothetical protein JXX29_16755 [Deltaproteobacteria bacterium]|nr:hypothetical protein [Deltaproteobacteria bacterium]MBN2673336.1 hypothetical protein [Deltaproteobacteria bacterium]
MNTESRPLSKGLIEEAIFLAQRNDTPGCRVKIEQMDRRIAHIQQQIDARPNIPTELQDAYRSEIDELTLENMQLTNKLEQTAHALEKAKEAYRNELQQTRLLRDRLDELEHRLLQLVNNP